ncbi:hypothetical protein WR25_25595 [Diploscapter pachys]|uniref:Uncharacterized protein n=1 Tax=Diploscapter pachys TaxID=2018661 RepID=A0A2A2JZB5_9BILA|nr:hypothetical protein WR25_25595 [Diploscapter pachys]
MRCDPATFVQAAKQRAAAGRCCFQPGTQCLRRRPLQRFFSAYAASVGLGRPKCVQPGVGIQPAQVFDLQADHLRAASAATAPGQQQTTAVFLRCATPWRTWALRASRSKVFTAGVSHGETMTDRTERECSQLALDSHCDQGGIEVCGQQVAPAAVSARAGKVINDELHCDLRRQGSVAERAPVTQAQPG